LSWLASVLDDGISVISFKTIYFSSFNAFYEMSLILWKIPARIPPVAVAKI
jgi:hypothetical protein